MARDELWDAVDTHRSTTIDLLTGLDAPAWSTPSLCDGWTVRDVAGHLTMIGLSRGAIARIAVRHLGPTNRLIRESARDLARRSEPAEIVEQLRAIVGQRATMPGLGVEDLLVDVIAHLHDIALPLGQTPAVPLADLALAADHAAGYRGRTAKVFRQLPWRGHRLVATDHQWASGDGPEIRGPMRDLFLLVTGRVSRPGDLTGPGVDALRSTLTT